MEEFDNLCDSLWTFIGISLLFFMLGVYQLILLSNSMCPSGNIDVIPALVSYFA